MDTINRLPELGLEDVAGLSRSRPLAIPDGGAGNPQAPRPEAGPAKTLGDVLYAGGTKQTEPEHEWARLVQAIARQDQAALHALYDRTHRPVFTLCARITGTRETAEEVTIDVYHEVWRRAGTYDPANGTVLGWIMNQARSRAIDRLRFENRRKRLDPGCADPLPADEAAEMHELLELKQRGEALYRAMTVLNPGEREAIEAAFFAGLTHAEAATLLGQPLGTVKTRIRSALQKLRRVLNGEMNQT